MARSRDTANFKLEDMLTFRISRLFSKLNTGTARQLADRFDLLSREWRVLALLEADALLGAFARAVVKVEAAGEPEPWMTTIGHGPARLPVHLQFAS